MAHGRAFVVPTPEHDDSVHTPFVAPEAVDRAGLQDDTLRRRLAEDFETNDIPENVRISSDEFIFRLQKSKLKYDTSLLLRLYSSVASKSKNGMVTGGALIDEYLKRVRELKAYLKTCKHEADRLRFLIVQSETNWRKAEAAENTRLGSQVPEEALLTVQAVSVRNFPSNVAPASGELYQLHLECHEQSIATEAQPYIDTDGEVFWNSMFSFLVANRHDELRISLIRVNDMAEMARCSVLLEELLDQRKHEMVKEMWGSVTCDLRVSCQWIYSSKLLYQNFVKDFVAKREEKHRELTMAQDELNALVAPFQAPRGFWDFIGCFSSLSGGPEYLSMSIDQLLDHLKLSNFQRALLTTILILLTLSSIASYARPQFLDLSIGLFAAWCCIDYARRWNRVSYLTVIGLLSMSLVFDVAWMSLVFDEDDDSLRNELGLTPVSKVFSLFNFIWKIVTILLVWKCYYDSTGLGSTERAESLTREAPR